MQKNIVVSFQLILLVFAFSVFAQNRDKDNALEMVGRLGSLIYASLAKDTGVSLLFTMQPFDRPQNVSVGIVNNSQDTIILEKSGDGALFLQIDTVVEGRSYLKKRLNWYPNTVQFVEHSKSDLAISPRCSKGFPIPIRLSSIHEGQKVSLFINMTVRTNRGELSKKEKIDFVYCESLCTSLIDTLLVLSKQDGIGGNHYSDVLRRAIGDDLNGLSTVVKKYKSYIGKEDAGICGEIRNMFFTDFRVGRYDKNIKILNVLSDAGILNRAFFRVAANDPQTIDSIVTLLTKLESKKHKKSTSCIDRYQFFLDMLSLSLWGVLGDGEIRVSYEEPKKALDTLEKYYPNATQTAAAYYTYINKVGCGDEAGLDLEGRNIMYKKIVRINPAFVSSDTIRYLICLSYLQCGHLMDADPKKASANGLDLIKENLPYIKNEKIRNDIILLQKRYNEIYIKQ